MDGKIAPRLSIVKVFKRHYTSILSFVKCAVAPIGFQTEISV
jgi:hypothetical protein